MLSVTALVLYLRLTSSMAISQSRLSQALEPLLIAEILEIDQLTLPTRAAVTA